MLNVKSLRSEPFLWIHLLGISVFPVFIGITIIGLSIGDSYFFIGELILLTVITVIPVFVMQFKRPFNIFSVLFLSLKPKCLNDRQKTILSLFKRFKHKFISAIAAVLMTALLWLLYRLSPLAVGTVGFIPQQRLLGLAIASVGFFASNLFFQIPLSTLLVLSTKQIKLDRTFAYSLDEITRDFTTVGIQIDRILWFIKSEVDSPETLQSSNLDSVQT